MLEHEACAAAGRRGVAGRIQYSVAWSTLMFDIPRRNELLHDQLEIYRRGVPNALRPECCPPPFDVANNWMREYPTAYVIPLGAGQRSDAEANRLVDWLLGNGIEVSELKKTPRSRRRPSRRAPTSSGWRNPTAGSPRRRSRSARTSPRHRRLYAPPGAWSHGYLWGADVVTIPRGAASAAQSNRVLKPSYLLIGGVEPGKAEAYALELDSATAVRALNRLVESGVAAQLATTALTGLSGATLPAGSAVFAADPATKTRLDRVGKENGLRFGRVAASSLSGLEPIERVPRIAVLTGAVNQDVWSLRNLGFPADPISTTVINTAPDDPLAEYDVIFNTGNYPSAANTTARARLTAFFAAGGGYVGAGAAGGSFLTAGSQVTGLTAATRSGSGGAASCTGSTRREPGARSSAPTPTWTRRSWIRRPGSRRSPAR